MVQRLVGWNGTHHGGSSCQQQLEPPLKMSSDEVQPEKPTTRQIGRRALCGFPWRQLLFLSDAPALAARGQHLESRLATPGAFI